MTRQASFFSSKKQRKYETSHPWIRFQCDLNRGIKHSVWMNLGAIRSKCKHVANTLLPPPLLADLQKIFLAKGVMATTAIEGNSMSEQEVREIIEGRSDFPKSREYQKQEVLNIVEACNAIVKKVVQDADGAISYAEICELNRRVLSKLPLPEGDAAGEVSSQNVVVGRYRGAPREDCKFLLQRLCDWINSDDWKTANENTLAFGLIRAVLVHLYLAWIHPFCDGNGRTARLVEFKLLLAAGAPLPAAHLLSSHYNQTRAEYYRQLDYASRSGGDVYSFIDYAVQGMVDGLDQQIAMIDGHQWQATWKEYVYSEFEEKGGAASKRQRQVALDLWGAGPEGVPINRVRSLSPQVAAFYGGRSSQAIVRDVKILEHMGLVERHEGAVRVKFHKLLEMRKPWAMSKSPDPSS